MEWKEEWDEASQLQRQGFFFPSSRLARDARRDEIAPSYPLDNVERDE